jgi:hypothetical protein
MADRLRTNSLLSDASPDPGQPPSSRSFLLSTSALAGGVLRGLVLATGVAAGATLYAGPVRA